MEGGLSTRALGKQGEIWARDFLIKKGYLPVKENYCIRGGEIDLIMRDGEDWVFIEVKTRYTTVCGLPETAIDWRKKMHLRQTAEWYAHRYNLIDKTFRLEVVAIEVDGVRRKLTVRHYRNVGWE